MRLFTAIELDDETRDGVAREQQRLRAGLGDAARSWRFVKREHLHLTLVFAGEIADGAAPGIVETMSTDIPHPAFEIALAGTGTFPAHGRPQVLWLGVQAGVSACEALHGAVAERLSAAGVTIDPRPFRPHLTLARSRDRRSGRLRLPDGPRTAGRVWVDHVTLFQSRLSSAGPTYTALARAQLS